MNSRNQVCKLEEGEQIPEPHEEEKKKVRRKRQSRRVNKQIPVNMAEARREIVSALKLHRASTKQKQIKQSLPLFPQFFPCFESQARIKSMRNPRIYPHDSVAHTLNLDHIPTQSLGLNLSFDDHFKTVGTSSGFCNSSHSFCSLSLLPQSSYFCSATHQQVPKSLLLSDQEEGKLMGSDLFWSNNGSTGDSGKQIQEAMNVKALDIHDHTQFGFDNIVATGEIEKAIEFPDWLSINDDLLQQQQQQQHSNYHCAEVDCLQDPDLSCLDIGDIEDVDGDWLA